jgi:hypothetical protein
MIRLYFNRHGDLPWSVDSGPGTKEFKFKVVRIAPGIRDVVTMYRPLLPDQNPEELPCAWLQIRDARVMITERGVEYAEIQSYLNLE